MRLAGAILSVLLSGCLTHHVLVAPVRIAEVARPLREDGAAVVTDVNDDRVRVEATEIDDARGRTLARLARPCVESPPNPYARDRRSTPRSFAPRGTPGCRFARERRLVRLERPDGWATAGLWGGAFLVTVVIGTVLGVTGVLEE